MAWFRADATVNHEALDIVDRLRRAGYPCYVASTQEHRRAAYLEEVVGLRERFDDLFFSCRVGTTKSDPLFYGFVANAIACDPGAILFFDDAEQIVETARDAGWNAELYRFGDELLEVLSSYRVSLRSEDG